MNTGLKSVVDFLNAAINPKIDRPHLRYIMVTDDNYLVATDGFRAHMAKTDLVDSALTPGHYSYDKSLGRLIHIPDSAVGREGYYLQERIGIGRIREQALSDDNTPLMMYSLRLGEFDTFSADRFPRGKGAGASGYSSGNAVAPMTFKRAKVAGEMRALCLGINALPLVWKEDGEVEINREGCITMESNFVIDAMAGGLTKPVIRWGDAWRPAIIGDPDMFHAIIMPISMPKA